jgi:hypothetical protein
VTPGPKRLPWSPARPAAVAPGSEPTAAGMPL